MSAQQAVAAVVVLAAGQGTRMRSATPKVLHPLAGRPMLRTELAAHLTDLAWAGLSGVVAPAHPMEAT